MPGSPRKVGIIGVGFGSQVYIPAFRSEGWDVKAICSRNREKAAKVAAEAGIRGVHSDPLELVGRDDLDAIAIASPPAGHRPLALAALAATRHVLCEKPFALDAAQATEMRDAADKSKLTAMVGHEFRFTPQRAFIKDLLAENYIGAVRLCTIELFLDRYVTAKPRPWTWLASKAEGGGLLGALGSHYIDALRHWFGDVVSVSGRLAILRPDLVDPATARPVRAETDDTYQFTLTFASGTVATMIASFATTPTRGAKIVVMGDRGTLIAEHPGPNPLADGIVVASRDGSALQPLATPARYALPNDDRDHRLAAFRALVHAFGVGIDERRSPAPNFTDGWRCQQVLDAVHASSASGQEIRVA
jgi:predicted dehydrogenase